MDVIGCLPLGKKCLAMLDGLKIAHLIPITIYEHIGFGVHPDSMMINGITKKKLCSLILNC